MAEAIWDDQRQPSSRQGGALWDDQMPAYKVPDPVGEAWGPIGKAYKDYIADPITKPLAGIINWPLSQEFGGDISEPASLAAAKFVVPQTPTDALLDTLFLGASKPFKLLRATERPLLSRLGKFGEEYPGLAQTAMTIPVTAGMDAASGLDVPDIILDTAKKTAITGLIGGGFEAARAYPKWKLGAGTEERARLAQGLGEALEQRVPALSGARTAEDFRLMGAGGGQQALSDMKEGVLQQIEDMPVVRAMPGSSSVTAAPVFGNYQFPVDGQMMSLREANAYLTAIGQGKFKDAPIMQTSRYADVRQHYGAVEKQIEDGIAFGTGSREGVMMFRDAQDQYQAGIYALKDMRNPQSYLWGGREGVEFNPSFYQRKFSDPTGEAAARRRYGDTTFEALRDFLLRGGPPGDFDRTVPLGQIARNAAPYIQGALGSFAGPGAGVAAGQGINALSRAPLFNLHYAGDFPRLRVDPSMQALFNVFGVQAGDAVLPPDVLSLSR